MNVAVLMFVEEDTERKRARNECMGKRGLIGKERPQGYHVTCFLEWKAYLERRFPGANMTCLRSKTLHWQLLLTLGFSYLR